jgi:4-amino-4-deoxy-L-arabinose transferase-like glycosyltransferase
MAEASLGAASERWLKIPLLRTYGELLSLPVIVMLAVLPQYRLPVDYNEAMFVVIGRETLHGALPYRDVFDQKPPLIYYFYAAVQGLTGDGFMVARVLIYVSLGATAILVALVAREFYSRRLAFVAGLVFALSTGLVAITVNAGLDQLTLLPLALAIHSVLRWRHTHRNRHLVIAGSAGAVALLLKPVVLPVAVFLGVVVLVSSRRIGPPAIMAGAASTVGAAAIAALGALGVLHEAYDAVIVFGREYAAAGWSISTSPGSTFWLLALCPLLVPAVASLAVLTVQRGWRGAFLGGLTAAALLSLTHPGAFLPYYAWQVIPALALLSPAILEWMAVQRRVGRLSILLPGTAAVTFGVMVAVGRAALPVTRPTQSEFIGTTIAAEAHEGDRLWVRANYPHVYYYAGLRPAHRYFTSQAPKMRAGAEAQTLAEIAAHPPRFIVVHTSEQSEVLHELLRDQYDAMATERELTAYRRRD